MPVLVSAAAPRPAQVPPIVAVNLDMTNVLRLARVVRAIGQLLSHQRVGCGALARRHSLSVRDVVCRLLLRRTGAGIGRRSISLELCRLPYLLRLEPIFLLPAFL